MLKISDDAAIAAAWKRADETLGAVGLRPLISHSPIANELLPVIVTAPHAVNHVRNNVSKLADLGTGGLALLLAQSSGCWAVVQSATDGDASWDEEHAFKEAVLLAANECQELTGFRPYVLDLHGMKSGPTRPDVDLGLGKSPTAAIHAFALSLVAKAHKEFGLDVRVNSIFTAKGPNTITSWAQRHELPAMQVEVSSDFRIPTASESNAARLVHFLSSAVTSSRAIS